MFFPMEKKILATFTVITYLHFLWNTNSRLYKVINLTRGIRKH